MGGAMKHDYLSTILDQIQFPREKSMAILIDAAVDISGSSEYPAERRQNILCRLATDGYFVDACHEALRASVAAALVAATFEAPPDFTGVARIAANDPDLQMLFSYLLKENEIVMGTNEILDSCVPEDERDFRLGEVAQQLPC